ncbi:MAG: class I SAM-dependent methyltransferase [Acutalibacteraceae bacterium]|nr:class I SAM-dependent methyltransferase [Acutalibacteraceae bacterium]
MKKSKSVDNSALTYYESGFERNRLKKDIGLIEFERTKEILLENLPKPPAVIYDIGGAYGEYSWWLASLGYEVHLFDLFPKNIEMSHELAYEYPDCRLASATVCDAINVPKEDKSADAVLLMGPLYHITDYNERIAAIKESRRLLKDGGILFTAALTAYSVLLYNITVYNPFGDNPNKTLEDLDFIKMVEREIKDGHHINPDNTIYSGIGSAYLHTAKALREELCAGGFEGSKVHGVMGGAWLANNIDELWKNEASKNALMNTVRLLDTCEEIIGLSGHLLSVSRK